MGKKFNKKNKMWWKKKWKIKKNEKLKIKWMEINMKKK